MKIYVKKEHCALAGMIVEPFDFDDDGNPINKAGNIDDDIELWGEGTDEEMIEYARNRYRESGYGGGRAAFERKCAVNVATLLGVALMVDGIERHGGEMTEEAE